MLAGSNFPLVGIVGSTAQRVAVTAGGALTVVSTAATSPWSSAPGFNVPVLSASSGLVQISGVPTIVISSSGAAAPTFVVASSISKLSSAAAVLRYVAAFTTAPTGAILRCYNASTSNVTMNTSVVASFLVGSQSTLSVNGPSYDLDALGMNFATALSFDVVVTATSTAAVAGNAYVTALVQ